MTKITINKLKIKFVAIFIIGAMIILGFNLYKLQQATNQLNVVTENLLLEAEKLIEQVENIITQRKTKDTKETDNE